MAEIFTPFLAAFILAYALRPVCLWFERHHVPRALAALLTMLIGLGLLFSVLSLFVNLLKDEIPLIKAQLPVLLDFVKFILPKKLSFIAKTIDKCSVQSVS